MLNVLLFRTNTKTRKSTSTSSKAPNLPYQRLLKSTSVVLVRQLFFFFYRIIDFLVLDYHISIHKKPLPGQPTPPVQELSFSTYGPNNRDNHIQSTYRRTHDNLYIQSLTNGEIIAFRTKPQNNEDTTRPIWAHHLSAPVYVTSISLI